MYSYVCVYVVKYTFLIYLCAVCMAQRINGYILVLRIVYVYNSCSLSLARVLSILSKENVSTKTNNLFDATIK